MSPLRTTQIRVNKRQKEDLLEILFKDFTRNINKIIASVTLALFLLLVLYYISQRNYLLFHSGAEAFSIVIASGIFFILWNSTKALDNKYFLILAIALMATAIIDTFHALAYGGMNVFQYTGASANDLSTQLWLAGRLTLGGSLIVAPFFIEKDSSKYKVLFVYAIICLILLLSIFYFRNFPTAYNEFGMTNFKVWSEIFTVLMMNVGLILLNVNRKYFSDTVFKYLFVSIIFMIISEILFTAYSDVYDVNNFFGHYLKIISYYYLYLAITVVAIKEPQKILYRDLNKNKEELEKNEQFLLELSRSLKGENMQKEIILKEIGEGIVMINKSGHLVYFNSAFNESFGIISGNVTIERISSLIKFEKKGQSLIKFLKEKEKNLSFYCYSDIGRKKKHFKISIRQIKNKFSPLGKIIIFRDISHQFESDQIKSNLVSFASHQMKTPLSILSLSANTLFKMKPHSNKKYIETLESISIEIEKLKRIINMFLDVSKLETNSYIINPKMGNINSVIDQAIEDELSRIIDKDIKLIKEVEEFKSIKIDKNALFSVVESILDNAMKYTPYKGVLYIRGEKVERNIVITIMNNGPAIPKSKIDTIFEKMVSGETEDEKKGFGIGLYLARLLTEGFGGEIKVESPVRENLNWLKNGKGTSFIISFPDSGMTKLGKSL